MFRSKSLNILTAVGGAAFWLAIALACLSIVGWKTPALVLVGAVVVLMLAIYFTPTPEERYRKRRSAAFDARLALNALKRELEAARENVKGWEQRVAVAASCDAADIKAEFDGYLRVARAEVARLELELPSAELAADIAGEKLKTSGAEMEELAAQARSFCRRGAYARALAC